MLELRENLGGVVLFWSRTGGASFTRFSFSLRSFDDLREGRLFVRYTYEEVEARTLMYLLAENIQ